MKLFLLVVLSVILYGCVNVSEKNSINFNRDTGKITCAFEKKHRIDSLYTALNYSTCNIHESTEGGTFTRFYLKEDTIKKEIKLYGETGKRVLHIYQENNFPFIIFDTVFWYSKPINANEVTEYDKIEKNVYCLDKKLEIYYWDKDNCQMPDSLLLIQTKIIREDFQDYLY